MMTRDEVQSCSWRLVQEALNARKIEPKENVAVLRKLVIEVEKMAIELENNLALLDSLEQSKADKLDLQANISLILIIVHIYVSMLLKNTVLQLVEAKGNAKHKFVLM
jgi:hypothetical protein